ncbi:MAG: bifunctional riboflavin kinase/FAD synthetase [Clostridia bacterium]|nr:bifunctional riboflavin kinase/FAD synthetase [Clostridia bacterium]
MEVLRGSVPYTEGTVVALGNFDGLHVAHMTIIRNGIEYAKEHNLKSGILLFDVNTKDLTSGGVELITPIEAKIELLGREKPDFVFMRKFDQEFMQKSPDEFARYLSEILKVRAVCCGYDYSFGYKAMGDVELLKTLGKKYGFEVLVTDVIKIDNTVVSSTYIRDLIREGDMEKAELFLGRRFCVEGIVVKGFQNGTKMGIPTANVAYDKHMAIPKKGVYAGITYIHGKRLKCVINVGDNPTFGARKVTIESHILDFEDNIYGEYIRVSFAKRLRGDIKFDSVDELIKQINKDIETARGMDL